MVSPAGGQHGRVVSADGPPASSSEAAAQLAPEDSIARSTVPAVGEE